MAPGFLGHVAADRAARLVTGGLLPLQLVLALAAGVTVWAALLVAFGVQNHHASLSLRR